MPPVKRFSKSDIIEAACEIVKKEGFENLNARHLADKLGSSVNPIFNNFGSMGELNRCVYEKIYEIYESMMREAIGKDKAYKKMGLAYIEFARRYPKYFKEIFMQKTPYEPENFVMSGSIGDDVIEAGQKLTGFTREEQLKFHVKVWTFTHGIACLVATNTVDFSKEDIGKLLEETVREMTSGYKIERDKRNEKSN